MADPTPDQVREQLQRALESGQGPTVARFGMAAIGGAIPLFGGLISGAAGAWSEEDANRFKKLLATWIRLQEDELRQIHQTLCEVVERLDFTDEQTRQRLESPEYLRLVKKCFRDWSAGDSEEKRRLFRNLLSNAAATRLSPDDVIHLFIDWIAKYSEAHFRVIREVYNNDGITRLGIWDGIHGQHVREDSADADLFKLIVHDLSIGHILRQERDTDRAGNFIKKRPVRTRARSRTTVSAFDDEKGYELTELGRQFVHYTMNEIVPRLTAGSSRAADSNTGSSISTSSQESRSDSVTP